MNASNSFKRKMFQLVLNILTIFSSTWSGIVTVATVVTSFTGTVQEIDEKAAEQQVTIKTYTANKKKRKREMAEKALRVRGKLSAFAAATGDTILLKKMKIAFYKLYYLNDTTAIANAQIILDAANDLTPAQKTDAEITAGDITELTDGIKTFKEVPSPDQMRAIRKQFTSQLNVLVKKANDILVDSLDGLMYQFLGTDFYEQYNNVRPLHESHRHTILAVNAVDEEGHDLSNVGVLLTSDKNNFQDITNPQGIAKQQISPETKYKAKFILPEYEEKDLEEIKLHAGEHRTIKVVLKKIA
jgi:hypothetical protein